MNFPKSSVFALIVGMAGGTVQAACVDRGLPAFVENAKIVRLCEGAVCSTGEEYSSCGNIYYTAQSYEVGSEIWLFGIRKNASEAGKDEGFWIEVRPSDSGKIPLTMQNGRLVRLLVGAPIKQGRAQHISCVPVSGTEACDFINAVLRGLNGS